MSTQSIKGFADLFSPQSLLYTRMETVARDIFSRFGYAELRTPIMEFTELFCRSIGTETDVVQKEMYTFPDRKDRSLTLRPEATAGVMRAYIQSSLYAKESVSKLFTYGPMFRYERPQKGRMRQFHQLNCECLGAENPHVDAEVITMLMLFLQGIGINDVDVQINTLGCPQCRPQYRKMLSEYLASLDATALCDDCKRRIETNPLRVLDCKVPTCKEHTQNAPKIDENTCPECTEHFSTVLNLLDVAKVSYVRNSRLVRGLDYYCRTTFEVVSGAVGAQSSIAGGGRYDGLVKQLGGPEVPGIGFACGMERLAMLMPEMTTPKPHFFVISMGAQAQSLAFNMALDLRKEGFKGDLSQGGSFKSQIRQADKLQARFVLILGEDECKNGTITVKNMEDGSQESITLDSLVVYMRNLISF